LASDHEIALVKQANDIVDVIGEHGVALTRRGRVYKGLCPFHNDHRPSMDVDPHSQRFRCWACGKNGDVFNFIQEKEKVSFAEALRTLAERAHIELKRGSRAKDQLKAKQLELMKWAAEQFHQNLFIDANAHALTYLVRERRLTRETIEQYTIGYAPNDRGWLLRQAEGLWPVSLLGDVGLIFLTEGRNPSDRFRDRIMFPIRDGRGRTVGFGGRILSGSAQAGSLPKYYNTSDTQLFKKSQNLYGIDRARPAAEKAGFIAVVEGYTDVLMAHQMGVLPVVATLGTALNSQHIAELRKCASRVVLVFDADAGGQGGVDSALKLFLQHEVDLAVATLPEGQDPCDFLLQHGPDAFRDVLTHAQDALDFKISRVCTAERLATTEGQRQALEDVLQTIAQIPDLPRQELQIKQQLVLTRLAQRFSVKEDTLWKRHDELRRQRRPASPITSTSPSPTPTPPVPAQRPDPEERELLELLLAHPGLMGKASAQIPTEEVRHPGLRRVLVELYDLHEAARPVTPERLRVWMEGRPTGSDRLAHYQQAGLARAGDAQAWFAQLVEAFARRRRKAQAEAAREQLRSHPDGSVPVDLLRRLQNNAVED
jgi:DNA primase